MNRAIAIACLVIVLAGFGWTYERVNKISSRLNLLSGMVFEQTDRVQSRLFMIRSQFSQAKNPVVFVGDSITEAALLPPTLCGLPVVNAGIGRETAASYARLVRGLFGHAFLVVVAIGTNDVLGYNSDFETSYVHLLDALPTRRPVLVALPPLEPVSSELERDNAIIAKIAKDRGLDFVSPDFSESPNIADGVHLSAKGYEMWLPPIVRAIERNCPR